MPGVWPHARRGPQGLGARGPSVHAAGRPGCQFPLDLRGSALAAPRRQQQTQAPHSRRHATKVPGIRSSRTRCRAAGQRDQRLPLHPTTSGPTRLPCLPCSGGEVGLPFSIYYCKPASRHDARRLRDHRSRGNVPHARQQALRHRRGERRHAGKGGQDVDGIPSSTRSTRRSRRLARGVAPLPGHLLSGASTRPYGAGVVRSGR